MEVKIFPTVWYWLFCPTQGHPGLQLGGVLHCHQSMLLVLVGCFVKGKIPAGHLSEWQASRMSGVKGEFRQWALMKLVGSKAASVVNTEYM